MNGITPLLTGASPGFATSVLTPNTSTLPKVAAPAVARVQPDPATGRDLESNAAPGKQPSAAELKKAVSELQMKTQASVPDLRFSIDSDTGRTVVKVTDANTKELIRQIPSEEVIRLNKDLDTMQGLLLNRQA